jgi:hypothetical protein
VVQLGLLHQVELAAKGRSISSEHRKRNNANYGRFLAK